MYGPRRNAMLAAPTSTEPTAELSMDAELYFLMANFLAAGPCRRAARELQAEIGELGLLPGDDPLSSMRRRHSCPSDQLRRLLRRLLELE